MDSIKAHAAYELSDELYMIFSKADLAYRTLCDASSNYSSYRSLLLRQGHHRSIQLFPLLLFLQQFLRGISIWCAS